MDYWRVDEPVAPSLIERTPSLTVLQPSSSSSDTELADVHARAPRQGGAAPSPPSPPPMLIAAAPPMIMGDEVVIMNDLSRHVLRSVSGGAALTITSDRTSLRVSWVDVWRMTRDGAPGNTCHIRIEVIEAADAPLRREYTITLVVTGGDVYADSLRLFTWLVDRQTAARAAMDAMTAALHAVKVT